MIKVQIDQNFIIDEIKKKIDFQYYHKVFTENKRIKAEWMLEGQKPENLVEDIFRKILTNLNIPENQVISQSKVMIFDVFKDKNRYPDFKLLKNRKSERNLLIELEPYNSKIQIGINQAKEWIQDIRIGVISDALAINLNSFIFISFDGMEVKTKELTIEQVCELISDVVFGEKTKIKLEDINKITEQFYNQFYAIIHGGSYFNTNNEKITISTEDCVLNNLLFDERLVEDKKVEFVYTIFNRLIFIKILMDWNLFPNIFNYLKTVPEHLIHTDLNNLFFKTLAVKEDERTNLPNAYDGIPFLNGGLFRKTEIEKEHTDLIIIHRLLVIVFDFLEEYTFIDNGDDSKSINSEILGYIFEKTIDFRKGTGSYYTHKLICDFMCENALYPHILDRVNNYLKVKLDYRDQELLENFEEIFMLREKTLSDIYMEIIKNLKVCDICVGSGAFLLSMANLLFDIHKKILTILHKEINETEIRQFIVEYNLFGVDFMLAAIQICQLRLWLWISENSDKVKPLPNIEYNLRVGNSLLGTATKIDISTVNYKFLNKINEADFLDKKDPNLKKVITELNKGAISFNSLKLLKTVLIDLYLYSHDKHTIHLKDLIDSLNELIVEDADRIYLDYLKNKIRSKKFDKGLSIKFLRRLKAFHWYLEFPQIFPKGFDLIVGNPPYISAKFMEKIWLEQDIQSLEKIIKKKQKRIKKLKDPKTIEKYNNDIQSLSVEVQEKRELFQTPYYQEEKLYNSIYKEFIKKEYHWAYKIYDILVPFFERGFQLLKNNSRTYLNFITSNKFLATDYGIRIREDFLNNYQIKLLVDISMIKVFKDAAVYPIIIAIKNTSPLESSSIKVGRYKDINKLGKKLFKIEQERYNKEDANYLIYIPLHTESFELFDKLYNHSKCEPVGKVFNNYYRAFDFTHWGDYEIFIKDTPGQKLGIDYYKYITNNDFSAFQIKIEENKYFHKIIPPEENPKQLDIPQEKWDLFKGELLMVKEVALDIICVFGSDYANIGKLYALRVKPESNLKDLSNYFFLAIFNSRLLDFYFRVIFWNTHLSGGYLNYHFSYLSILPILKIDKNSQDYRYIIFLSKVLAVQFDSKIKDLLDILILHAYFPEDIEIEKKILSHIEEIYENNITDNTVDKINQLIKDEKNSIEIIKKHKYFQILLKERKFKE